jgi:hypothetical protein
VKNGVDEKRWQLNDDSLTYTAVPAPAIIPLTNLAATCPILSMKHTLSFPKSALEVPRIAVANFLSGSGIWFNVLIVAGLPPQGETCRFYMTRHGIRPSGSGRRARPSFPGQLPAPTLRGTQRLAVDTELAVAPGHPFYKRLNVPASTVTRP